MLHEEIISKTVKFVQESLKDAEGGHDRWHIYRVWKTTKNLAQEENVDLLTVELGALLHDIADAKFHNGDETVGPRIAGEFLQSIEVDPNVITHVQEIIRNISFGGGNSEKKFTSPELSVVQDADRLDSMGAIGIARTFNYGGHKGRELYNPNIEPNLNMTKEEYRNSASPSLNHFYEKLLLLKDRMNTKAGKKMAEHRHNFLEHFLQEFLGEREGTV